MNTLLDDLGIEREFSDALKEIYLDLEPLKSCAAAKGWSRKELIDTVEKCRREGLLEILRDAESETLHLRFTEAAERALCQ